MPAHELVRKPVSTFRDHALQLAARGGRRHGFIGGAHAIGRRHCALDETTTEHARLAFAGLGSLGAHYWAVVALAAVLTLARFSEAFLVLRALDVGLAAAQAPLVMALMAGSYALISYPAGRAADRGRRRALLIWGLLVLVCADVLLAAAGSSGLLFAGVALWGAHMGLTQGLLSTLVADAAPETLRGTAFGVFHLVTGAALLAASLLAGWLWSAYGPAWTFGCGAAFTAVALIGLLVASRAR